MRSPSSNGSAHARRSLAAGDGSPEGRATGRSARCPARLTGRGDEEPRIGSRWGPFELLRVLGRGGMGTVYEAVDHLLERHVAIKLWSAPQPDSSASALKSARRSKRSPAAGGDLGEDAGLLREARVVARLEHPNIVPVYQLGRQGDTHFIAMQLMRGGSVAALVQGRGPLAVAEAARVIREAARGLAAAHAVGVVHRDVKPANLLLGEDGSVKVADFGLALDEGNSGTPEAGAGTPDYMSPEQAQGFAVDARSDVYGLGATWCYLLTGAPPFRGETALHTLWKHVHDPVPDVRRVRPDVPAACALLIRRSLAKRPEERPQSATALVAELDRFLEEEGENRDCSAAAPGPDSARSSFRLPPSFRRGGLAAAILGVVIAVFLVGHFHSRNRLAQAERDRLPPSTDSSASAQTPKTPTEPASSASSSTATTPSPDRAAEDEPARRPLGDQERGRLERTAWMEDRATTVPVVGAGRAPNSLLGVLGRSEEDSEPVREVRPAPSRPVESPSNRAREWTRDTRPAVSPAAPGAATSAGRDGWRSSGPGQVSSPKLVKTPITLKPAHPRPPGFLAQRGPNSHKGRKRGGGHR